jgi:hypothetical protein
MGICILGMGDCANKSDSKAITNIKNINKSMTNMVSSTRQSSNVQSINTQSNTVEVVWPKDFTSADKKELILAGVYANNGCSFNNVQKMNASQKVSISLNLENKRSLQKQISSHLKAEQEQATKQKTEFLATSPSTANSYTEINQVIDNLVSTNIDDSVMQDLKQIMQNFQGNKLIIEGPIKCTDGKPYATNVQEMLVNQISESLTKALTGTTLAEAMASSAESSQKQKTEQESGGLTGFIKGLFEGLSSLISGPIMIIGLIVVVLAILAYVFRGTISKIAEKKTGVSGAFGRRRR